MTSTQSMDYAILESSDEHKPMETCDSTAGQSGRTHEQMEISASSLHGSEILHQNVNYTRNRGVSNKNNSDNYSASSGHHASGTLTQLKSSQASRGYQNSSVSHERRPQPVPEVLTFSAGDKKAANVVCGVLKPQQEVFATPCQKG